jgi:peptide/nickel transport system substrate-binding protein
MSRSLTRVLMAVAAVLATFVVAACGGGNDNGGGGGGGGGASTGQQASGPGSLLKGTASSNTGEEGKRGGKITMLTAGDVDFIDPGRTYYSFAFAFMQAAHRMLYSYKPGSTDVAEPDLAESQPQVSADGKTVTVKIRKGVKFSPPVNREVTSADVKYAIERGFTANLGNGYARAYFGDLVGATKKPGPYKPISGIETPDPQTIVFKLTKGTGRVLAGALVMPLTAPVPKEYARKYDAKNPTTYGEHQVATGPYMIENDASGKLTGYKPGQLIHLVRNPNYQKVGDYRPAYVDDWTIQEGNDDTGVAARRILAGQSMVSGDGGAGPPAVLKQALQRNKPQISLKPSGGWRIISMDTKKAPFNDINVRKAVIAGFDREALRLARGGPAVGPIAQHYIPPGINGYDEAGGLKAPGDPDWMRSTKGDKAVMAKYFKAAGMASGKFEGKQTILLVADSAEPEKSVAQITEKQLNDMGFKTKLRLVERSTMFTKFCNVPGANVDVCTSVGWLKDFPDPQTMLDPTFNGENILPANNSNWPQLDVPAINKAMDKAKLITDPKQRAQAWADIDKQIVAQAPAIPYLWDFQEAVASKNVNLVQNLYSTMPDLAYTSLK